ncbi:hypothetical protein DL762_009676 [Monosporascus cannonballus]|uniref:Major facilitator superfamily (MFS) profile domain-containing protein n=1 Tax=Monosporascus cannonballus TaxID=155416 RepID=A0ABY0GXD0_9PEZI|nr:hypothetical protein DL762_009676 [Monosporascus cannonballus]
MERGGVSAETATQSLNRKLDPRLPPLCCWLYLLNFLNRRNIGNARILNRETGDDLMAQTGMTSQGYAITLTLFSVAYAVFEVPSNWAMKHHVRLSLWLAFLLARRRIQPGTCYPKEIVETFFSLRMLEHCSAYIAHAVLQGSFKFFPPTIVSGLGYQSVQAQLMTVPPLVVGFSVAFALSHPADHFDARG